jgi:putative transposase
MANYKRIFLDGHSYYITVVTHQRNPILIENIALLRESFQTSKNLYKYTIEAITILPDHFHMIITPENAEEYPHIVRTIKQHFSKNCPEKYYRHLYQSWSRNKKGYLPVWQKRYYEHTIRNEKDMLEKMQYLYHNPVKHAYVGDPNGWEYSSFKYGVK